MTKLFHPVNKLVDHDDTVASKKISLSVFTSLVSHVYMQTNIAMGTSLFCACVVFIGLFSLQDSNTALYLWFAFYLLITLTRLAIVHVYKKDKHRDRRVFFWCNLYILGAALGGISWGVLGVYFLPQASEMQQALIVLMAAGVTAGSVPLSSGIPGAAIAFLVFTIVPFIFSIAFINNYEYLLFDTALTLYLVYSIVMVIRGYYFIKNSIELRFENDTLLENISETKNQLEFINKKLELAATHDPLTGLANRTLFQLNFENAIEHARASKKFLVLLYIDIDNFKPVNDQYGHHMGDTLLLILSERLRNIFGQKDMLARIGGDELAIIIENVSNLMEITNVAKKTCQLIAMPIKVKDIELRVSASIGVSIYPNDGHDVDTLLRGADKNMYHVKDNGGNDFYHAKRNIQI